MKINNRVHIDAPPELVWEVFVNVMLWPNWTPTIWAARTLDGHAFGVGSRYALIQPMQPEAVWQVTDCAPGTGFTWARQGRRAMRATHFLEPSAGGTIHTLTLEATGPLIALLRPVLSRALKIENAGLKAFCESCACDATG